MVEGASGAGSRRDIHNGVRFGGSLEMEFQDSFDLGDTEGMFVAGVIGGDEFFGGDVFEVGTFIRDNSVCASGPCVTLSGSYD